MAWVYLIIAGLFEVVWAVCLKYTEGFTKLMPSIATIAGMIISFGLLSMSLITLPIGTAYAVWTGIGAVGTVIVGIFLFNEPTSFTKFLFIGMILAGIIGIKATS
jgi:quaternary ammonium compound-resistance protein SugE